MKVMNIKRKLFKEINKTVFKSSTSLLIITGIYISLLPETNFALTLNQPISVKKINGQDDAFEKKFREGRDLIDKEDWAKAGEKFNEIVSKYPGNKSTDAALYWLAFCYKKQKLFKETDVTLDRLLKEFPASSWVEDAKVMKMEILKGQPAKLIEQISALPAVPVLPVAANQPNVLNLPNTPNEPTSVEPSTGVLQTLIDRETEIKLAAFKSLLSADPKRAIQTMGDILTPDSKASEIFKQTALRVLRNPSLFQTQASANTSASVAENQLLTLLRETLIKSFQKETNIKIRKEIIYTLGGLNDDRSINYLVQLYASEGNQENKKAIINSLFQLLGKSQKQSEKGFDAFARLYDAETDEQFKMSIIRILSDSKQTQAFKKLLEIAKNDKSDKLKLHAIHALRTSNNPEVLKFLEELIK
jgi:hypothetical protein